MENLSDKLLSAMAIMVDGGLKKIKADCTIEGKIVKIGSSMGEYIVSYLGNDITVYGDQGKYNIGDTVSVSVPNGDFGDKKTIKGVTSFSLKTGVKKEVDSSMTYNIKSPNIINDTISDISLISYNERKNEENGLLFNLNSLLPLFKGYMKDFEYIKIGIKAKTELPMKQKALGNYGVVLYLPFLSESGERIIRDYPLTTDKNMIGDFYNFQVWSNQEVFYKVDNLRFDDTRNPVLEIICDNFKQDETIVDPDIFLKDISIEFAEVIDKTESSYSLNVVASEGRYFSSSFHDDKILSSEFKIQGSKIDDLSKISLYWFKENNKIDKNSDGYCKEGGIGWECLNPKTVSVQTPEGESIFKYSSVDTIKVKEDDIFCSIRYKCIGVYDNISVTGYIDIENLNNDYEILLTTESNSFIKDIGKAKISCRVAGYNADKDGMLYFYWNRYDENLNYLDTFNTNRNEVSLDVAAISRVNTVSVTIEQITNTGETRHIGSKSISLFNLDKNDNYIINIMNGNQSFKYDSCGNSPCIVQDNYIINPIYPTILKNGTSEFTQSEYDGASYKWYIPKNKTLIKIAGELQNNLSEDDEYWYVNDRYLYFNIASSYNDSNSNNSIRLDVTVGDKVITSYTGLSFIKEGDNGTNGTDIRARLKYLNQYGKEIPLVLGYDYYSNRWLNISEGDYRDIAGTMLTLDVFNNDTKLGQMDYSVTKWEMLDPSQTSPSIVPVGSYSFPYSCSLYRSNTTYWRKNDVKCNIIKVTVKINAGNYNGKEVIAFYPVDCCWFSNINAFDNLVPFVNGGFNSVTYEPDGTNPSYRREKFYIKLNDEDFADIVNYEKYGSQNLEIKNLYSNEILQNNEFYCKPIDKFDNGISKNCIKINITIPQSKKQEITERKNIVETELENVNLELNKLLKDNTALSAIVASFNYDELISKLKDCSQMLTLRGIILNKITYIRELIKSSQDTINSHAALSNNYGHCFDSILEELAINENRLYDICFVLNSFPEVINIKDIEIQDPQFKDESDNLSFIYFNRELTSIKEYITSLNGNIVEFTNSEKNKEDIITFSEIYTSLSNTVISTFNYSNSAFSNRLSSLIANINNKNKLNKYSYFSLCQTLNEIRTAIYYYSTANGELNTATEKENKKKEELLLKEKSKIEKSLFNLEQLDKMGDNEIIYYAPVVMLYNRYSMSNLNAWDGNKIYTDTSGEYILAPQFGAGKKNSDNSFTGLVMGLKSTNNTSNIQAGLFGYSSGRQTIELNAETGTAVFGLSGYGQIRMIPNGTSTIAGWEINEKSLSKKSGNNKVTLNSDANEETKAFEATNSQNKTYIQYNGYFFSDTGKIGGWKLDSSSLKSAKGDIVLDASKEKITLANEGIVLDGKNKEISCGSNFKVNNKGEVTMSKGTVGQFHLVSTGFYNDDQTLVLSVEKGVVAKKGSIGGWTIGSNKLTSTNENVVLNSDGSAQFGSGFSVTQNGKITATAGTIGGWVIGESRLRNADSTVFLNSDGSVKFGDNFSVSKTGSVKASAGNIGGWSISSSALKSKDGSVILDPDGTTKFGSGFSVTQAGKMTCSTGSIGGWAINSDNLKGGSVTFNKSGALSGSNWSITAAGKATFSNLNATGGKVGGWTIGTASLTGGSLTLNNTGSLSGSNWSITAGGKATFANLNMTGGNISGGTISGGTRTGGSITGGSVAISGSGTTINGSGASLSESKTKVGSKNIATYVGDIFANKITATKIKTSQLVVDTVNGKNVDWLTTDVVTAIRGKAIHIDVGRMIILQKLIPHTTTINGKTVMDDIEVEGVVLNEEQARLIYDIQLYCKKRSMTIFSGGGEVEERIS